MNFYAIATDLPDNPNPGTGTYYHIFDSRNGRDTWVQNTAEAKEYGETREVLPSSDRELRRLIYASERVTDGDSDYDDELYYHYQNEEGD